jgi:signal transduction histidine kinase
MRKAIAPLAVLAAIPLGIIAYRIQVYDIPSPADHAAAIVTVAWAFVAAGAVAWWCRCENRLGLLLMAAGLALLLRQLRYSHDALVFTVFFALGELAYALVPHSALAYPFGAVRDRAGRALVRAGYAVVLAFPLAILLFHAPNAPLIGFFDPAPRESLLMITGDADLVEVLQKALVVVFYFVLGSCFIALLVHRLVTAPPRMRRILAPLLLAAIAIALRAVFEGVLTFVDQPFASEYLFWWQIGAFVALPLALLAGLLRARLARASVGDLVLELERTPPHGMRDALARALGDPTLELAFWLPEQRTYADSAGNPFVPPADDSKRVLTPIEHRGQSLAVIAHDPSLREEPKLVQAAGAAAHLALENARLQAETRAQLVQVQESRARIVAAGDDARRRIERDLHDGAQQRLVALALQLRTAQRKLGGRQDPELDLLLATAASELQAAVTELRELARGVHPAILTEEGLAAALESLTSRTRTPVSLDVCEDRLPPPVEATAYFVVCEALTNVTKHADAAGARISAQRRNGTLVVEVEDDGVGGAQIGEHSGLRGLIDRVEALGGRVTIESPRGLGTRIEAEIPCGS